MNTKVQHQTCLLLGSNIEPGSNLTRSFNLLQEHMTILQTSSVWESEAIGSDGPNFLNAAVLAMTTFDAEDLKIAVLRPLEAQLGRVRTKDKNAARTIDVDIIVFDQVLMDDSLWQYAHVAVPVSEILPEFHSETGNSLKDFVLDGGLKAPLKLRDDLSTYPFSTIFVQPRC